MVKISEGLSTSERTTKTDHHWIEPVISTSREFLDCQSSIPDICPAPDKPDFFRRIGQVIAVSFSCRPTGALRFFFSRKTPSLSCAREVIRTKKKKRRTADSRKSFYLSFPNQGWIAGWRLGDHGGERPREDMSRLLRNGLTYHTGVSAGSNAEITESDPTVKSFSFFSHLKARFSERDLV